MNEYITKADVDEALGSGWETTGDAEQAVMEANIWLTSRRLPFDPTPDAVTQAGALLARDASKGLLYADTTGAIKRKRVKADTVETETEYKDGDNRRPGSMRLILDMLRPWLGSGSTFEVRRG